MSSFSRSVRRRILDVHNPRPRGRRGTVAVQVERPGAAPSERAMRALRQWAQQKGGAS